MRFFFENIVDRSREESTKTLRYCKMDWVRSLSKDDTTHELSCDGDTHRRQVLATHLDLTWSFIVSN